MTDRGTEPESATAGKDISVRAQNMPRMETREITNQILTNYDVLCKPVDRRLDVDKYMIDELFEIEELERKLAPLFSPEATGSPVSKLANRSGYNYRAKCREMCEQHDTRLRFLDLYFAGRRTLDEVQQLRKVVSMLCDFDEAAKMPVLELEVSLGNFNKCIADGWAGKENGDLLTYAVIDFTRNYGELSKSHKYYSGMLLISKIGGYMTEMRGYDSSKFAPIASGVISKYNTLLGEMRAVEKYDVIVELLSDNYNILKVCEQHIHIQLEKERLIDSVRDGWEMTMERIFETMPDSKCILNELLNEGRLRQFDRLLPGGNSEVCIGLANA